MKKTELKPSYFLIMSILLAALALSGLNRLTAQAAPTAVFIVDSVGDTDDINHGDGACFDSGGLCTLRAAIQEANALPGADTIRFDATPGAVIGLTSPLPVIEQTAYLHGDTHPNGMVELDGNSAAGHGFHVSGSGSEIIAFRIHSFAMHGIYVDSTNNRMDGNIIGIPAEGAGAGNGGDGILVDNVSDNTMDNNVVSGNGLNGIELFGSGATNNTATNNLIGTDVNGVSAVANSRSGILIDNATGNTIGDSAGNGNLVSGNGRHGIEITGIQATQNNILGNKIGTNLAGSTILPNTQYGIYMYSASANIIGGVGLGRNLISGNARDGILMTGAGTTDNHVRGNYIGVTASGTAVLGNGESGVHINHGSNNTVGGTTAGMGNLISGNGEYGVEISSDTDISPGPGAEDNIVQGNFIGTDATGMTDLGNTLSGVYIISADRQTIGGDNAAARNLISGNNAHGVEITTDLSDNNTIQGNYIGINLAGTAVLGNSQNGVYVNQSPSNIIDGNLISGNGSNGIKIRHADANYNSVSGNSIGLNEAGGAALPNQENGILLDQAHHTAIGGTTSGEANTVSGNAVHGVMITGATAYSNTVVGNHIGVNQAGSTAFGNGGSGIMLVNTQGNIIGGTATGAENVISGNVAHGVYIGGTSVDNQIRGNLIGTAVNGNAALSNRGNGITIDGVSQNEIGGVTTGQGNLISGNGEHGVYISGGAADNQIAGNKIGMNGAGNGRLPNNISGVAIYNGRQNDIGGATTASRNWIGGNGQYGILISGTTALSNTIRHNYIGTDITGTTAVTNTTAGIIFTNVQSHTIGGDGSGNLISGNGIGIFITGTKSLSNTIQGNLIGTNNAGTASVGNKYDGIRIGILVTGTLIGGTTASTRNLISGNGNNGIALGCTSGSYSTPTVRTTITGNYVGVNASGTAALPNWHNGIKTCAAHEVQIGGTVSGVGNLVSGNWLHGIDVDGEGTVIQGNYVGTNAAGTTAVANRFDGVTVSAPNTLVGGTQSGAGNLISGNGDSGLVIRGGTHSQMNTVQGNYIGTNAAGTAAVGNGDSGILIDSGSRVGGNSAAARNIISGNGGCGVETSGSGQVHYYLQGNYIGTNASGSGGIGNTTHGVCMTSGGEGLAIGGVNSGEGNIIAYNGGDGINFTASSGLNRGSPIRHNLIYANTGDGIDLADNGVTANDVGDADTGAQKLQNYPLLVEVRNTTSNTTITGALNSTANSAFMIDFFVVSSCDASGYGEGETFLGSADITTDGSGNASFTPTFSIVVPANHYVTMTATDFDDNTSEFSQCPATPTAVSLREITAVRSQGNLFGLIVVMMLLGMGTVVFIRSLRRGVHSE